MHFARRLGAVTYAANNYKASETNEDGTSRTVILRDSSGYKPEKRPTQKMHHSESELSSLVASATLVDHVPAAPAPSQVATARHCPRRKARKRTKAVEWCYTPPEPPKFDWYPVGTASRKEHYKELLTATASISHDVSKGSVEGLANAGESVFAAPSASAPSSSASSSTCSPILDRIRPQSCKAASSTAAHLRERPLYSRGNSHSGKTLERDVSALLQPRKLHNT